MSIELRVLRYVVAVAEHGGFQRAAERLHMAQPPLSRQIAELERHLGVRLFERRPTRLTPAGEVFVAAARRLLADAETLVERTRQAAPGATVRIGYIASAAYDTLPRLLSAARSACPATRVDARESWSPELELGLRDRRLGLVLSHSIAPADGLSAVTLRRETLVAVVGARHPLAGRSAVRLRDLRGETFCFLGRALVPDFHDLVVSALRKAGEDFEIWEHPVPGLRVSPLRDDGSGFTLVCESAGTRLGAGLVALPLLDRLPAVEVRMVWRTSDVPLPAQTVLQAAYELARGQSWGN